MNQRQQFLLCHWKPTSRRVRGTFAFGPHSCIAALMLPFVGGIAARRAYLAECGRLTPRRYPLAKRSASRQGRLSPRVLEATSPSGQKRSGQSRATTSGPPRSTSSGSADISQMCQQETSSSRPTQCPVSLTASLTPERAVELLDSIS